MIHTKKLLSKRYSRKFRYFLKLPTRIQPVLRNLEKELLKNSDYLNPFPNCPVCGFEKSTIISENSRYNLPMEIQICNYCGLIFNLGGFSREFMLRYYKNFFYLIRRPGSKKIKLLSHIKKNGISWKRHSFLKNFLGEKYDDLKTVVEVGCGDGGNLFPFFSEGIRTIGCDFDEGAIKEGKNIGLELYLGDIDCLIEKRIKSDLIILPHVLAHISEMDNFLLKISKIINPNGYLYVESDGIFAKEEFDLKNKNLLWYFQFDFITCFELRTLSYVLKKNGFKIEYGDENIRCISTLQLKGNNSIFTKEDLYNNGEVLKKVFEIEKNYLNQGIIKYFFREIRGYLYLVKNIAIFLIIDLFYLLKFNKKR